LSSNTPNPFNPTTTIAFSIPTAGPVALSVHDITGRRVATLAQGVYQPGDFTAVWNGKDDAGTGVPSGIYFARLHAGEYTATKKMALIK
jgi:flagellar hook assembly protein FlgD